MGDNGSPAVPSKTEFNKYKIGKVKSTPSIQRDAKTNLTYIKLRKRSSEKVYGCTIFQDHYREDEKLGQGTFGEVYKGIHLETQRQVAMKKIIVSVEKDLFPITAQREITILKRLNHKNIIKLIEMVYDHSPDPTNSASTNLHKAFYMILPYMVADLSGVLHNPRINLEMCDIKNMMLQILEGLNYIHCAKFMHRDIKTANILIDHNGVLKLADFGLARLYYGCPPNLKYPGGAGSGAKYTSVVVTRWYRAPELVLGDKQYTTAVDIWGVGCVFAECFEKKPILQGKTDIDQGHVIFKLLGTPTKEDWVMARHLPGAELTTTNYKSTIKERFGKYLTETGLDFLKQLLALDPYKRLTAMSAKHHPWFTQEPLPSERIRLPSEESHEADIKRYKEEMHQSLSQRVPTAPRGHTVEKSESPVVKSRMAMPRGPKKDDAIPIAPLRDISAKPPPSKLRDLHQNPRPYHPNNGYPKTVVPPPVAPAGVNRYVANNTPRTNRFNGSNAGPNSNRNPVNRFHPETNFNPKYVKAPLPLGPQSRYQGNSTDSRYKSSPNDSRYLNPRYPNKSDASLNKPVQKYSRQEPNTPINRNYNPPNGPRNAGFEHYQDSRPPHPQFPISSSQNQHQINKPVEKKNGSFKDERTNPDEPKEFDNGDIADLY
ncbi:sgv1p [Saccharomyces arboricola H-6]|uniref:Serine/threonine-protein kinase BUR1 n=1 Tax=Saccharomyces arboricola (strain H-6 / AS 2.3317 / CBS 10644) TaxID=1160507 RepID=J8Q0Q9_SACAR|nr:sgv1p [Saccharomyces arboricola H-6]